MCEFLVLYGSLGEYHFWWQQHRERVDFDAYQLFASVTQLWCRRHSWDVSHFMIHGLLIRHPKACSPVHPCPQLSPAVTGHLLGFFLSLLTPRPLCEVRQLKGLCFFIPAGHCVCKTHGWRFNLLFIWLLKASEVSAGTRGWHRSQTSCVRASSSFFPITQHFDQSNKEKTTCIARNRIKQPVQREYEHE